MKKYDFRIFGLFPGSGFLVLVVALFIPCCIWGQDLSSDVEALKEGNKALFMSNYKEALQQYEKVSKDDGALSREAALGQCLCLALLAFTAETAEEAIENFMKLIGKASKPIDTRGMGDGSIFINVKFITNLKMLFGWIGGTGAADTSQGLMLESDAKKSYGNVINQVGTDAQKKFVKFFSNSMILSEATESLDKKDFEGCVCRAAYITDEKPEHINKSSKSLQEIGKRLIEIREQSTELESKLRGITLDPNDPNAALLEQAKELAKEISTKLKP